MNHYTLDLLARISLDERLAEAEATRRLRLAKRAQRRETPVPSETTTRAAAPVCSSA
jgi:hypothetical protein